MLKWFKVLIKWLESESGAERYTLTELHSKMVEFSDGDDVYTIKRLKQKLQEHYKEHTMLKGVRMLFALKIWLSISSMKSGNHQGTAWWIKLSGLYLLQQKSYVMKSEKKIMIANLTQPMKTLHLL